MKDKTWMKVMTFFVKGFIVMEALVALAMFVGLGYIVYTKLF